ncbi:MAG TPA: cytochrome c [Ramlibacter sp.]|nr:cytochrome c [Ramlibacter sp.]
MKRALVAMLVALGLVACEREARRFDTPVNNQTPTEEASRTSNNQPALPQQGKVRTALRDTSPYDENAYAVNQGKRLYHWFNCNGCHSNGGGGIGPPLMDSEWKYGGDSASIFNSIMQGRPEGMPSFGGHIPEDQVWQIVAYVRSMSGQLRKDVAPSRADTLYPGNPENAREKLPVQAQKPPAAPASPGVSR